MPIIKHKEQKTKNMNKLNKKIYLYPVKIEAHEDGGFHAKCPKLQGAWADGDTIKETINNLRDVIKCILQYKKERKKKLFAPPIISPTQSRLISDLNLAVYA